MRKINRSVFFFMPDGFPVRVERVRDLEAHINNEHRGLFVATKKLHCCVCKKEDKSAPVFNPYLEYDLPKKYKNYCFVFHDEIVVVDDKWAFITSGHEKCKEILKLGLYI